MEPTRVTVCIPSYNQGNWVSGAIESVLNQSYPNIELIIADSDSIDNTKEIIQSYSSDRRVCYIRKKDKGPAEGRNNGIKISKGKYIAILDSDDFWRDTKKIAKQVKFLEERPGYVLVGGGTILVDEKGLELRRVLPPENDMEIRKLMLCDCLFFHSTVLFKRDAWEAIGGYDEKGDIGFSDDWDLYLRLGEVGKFYNFQDYFTFFLQGEQSNTQYIRRENTLYNLKLIIKYRNKYPNFYKAFLVGLVFYSYSFLPRPKWFRFKVLSKIKNTLLGYPIYKKIQKNDKRKL